MKLIKTISKTQKHSITYETPKGIQKKEVPNTYLWLVLDSGVKILISAVKKEDRRLLDSHATIER